MLLSSLDEKDSDFNLARELSPFLALIKIVATLASPCGKDLRQPVTNSHLLKFSVQ